MTFQEMLEADREEVIFSLEELAAVHVIDGQEYALVQTSATWRDAGGASANKSINPKEAAINSNVYTLYIKTDELKRKLTAGSHITYDGRRMFVNDVKNEKGITKVLVGIHKTI